MSMFEIQLSLRYIRRYGMPALSPKIQRLTSTSFRGVPSGAQGRIRSGPEIFAYAGNELGELRYGQIFAPRRQLPTSPEKCFIQMHAASRNHRLQETRAAAFRFPDQTL